MATIRLAHPSDGREVAEIYAPVVAGTAISFEAEIPDAGEMARRIDGTLPRLPWLVCVRDGRIDGYVYASPHRERAAYRWCVDVSVYVRDGCRRGGIGRALYTSLFALLRAQGFYAAHAGVTLPNAASVGLHEGLGFQPIGVYPAVGYKLGAWHDVGWWQLPLRDRAGEPTPVLTLAELRRTEAWEGALAAGAPLLGP